MREFVAIDGEGVTTADGRHAYILLCASDGSYTEHTGGLTSHACLEYLLELKAAHPAAVFVIFGGAYDFQMMLRDAAAPDAGSDDRNWRALLAGGYFSYKVPGRTYRLQARMRHSLYVAQGAWVNGEWVKQQSLHVWDVIGWFQSSFIDALEAYDVGTRAERQFIRSMKEGRATFTTKQRRQVRAYSLRECALLAELMGRVAEVLDARGIRPARWDGAGAGAAALLRKHGTDKHIARTANADLGLAIDCAYFGGRIQQFVSGQLPGSTYVYDLSAAYPHAMMTLPCLAHGQWQRHDADRAPVVYDAGGTHKAKVPGRKLDRVISKWSLFHVRWSSPAGARLTPLPFRDVSGISWPREGEGWYWSEEVAAAVDCGYHVELLDRWSFVPGCDEEPFAWMRDLYAERRALGDDPAAEVIKLMQAAVYGKIVQAQREGQKRPSFQSYVWGGLTTAHVRAQVLRMAHSAAGRIGLGSPVWLVAIQTDGILTTAPLPAADGWTQATIEPGLLVIQPGVMLSPSARFVRSRGFARGSISYGKALRAWGREGFAASIPVKERRFVTADWAEFTGHREWWLSWREIPRDLTFATIPRMWPRPGKVDPKPDGLYEELYPPDTAEGISAPYHAPVKDPSDEEAAYAAMVEQQPEVG